MNIGNKLADKHKLKTGLIILSIAIIAVLSYKEKLSYFFTSTAVLAIVENGRIQSFNDLIDIFTEDLMAGTTFLGKFYRPILAVSLGIDYSIWGLNPFGYHLTDIIIHILVAISVYFFTQALTKGKYLISWLSAAIFTLHPVIISAVIGTDKRNDTLATLFLILSLLTFLKHLSALSYKRFYLVASIFFYALAFGSKEIGIIIPFITVSYLFIFSDEISYKTRIFQSIKKNIPYIITAIILIAWRSYILGSIAGGYGLYPDDIIILNYYNYLLNPTNFLQEFYSTPWIFIFPIIPVFISLVLCKRIISGSIGMKTLKVFLLTGLIISSICVIVYPFPVEPFLDNTHINEDSGYLRSILSTGFQIFSGLLTDNASSVSDYLWETRILTLNKLYNLIFIFMLLLAGILNYGYNRNNLLPISHNGKVLAFLCMWLLSPLSVYLSVLSLATWQMYIALVPFSIIISLIFVERLRALKDYARTPLSHHMSTISVTCLILVLLLYSPPLGIGRTGDIQKEWRDVTKAREIILPALLEKSSASPYNISYIKINNIPVNFWTPRLLIRSWFNLNYPGNNIKEVIVNKVPHVNASPESIEYDMKLEKTDDDMYELILTVKDFN